MVRPAPDDTAETPEQMRRRADDLRECARTARRLAGTLGPYLDKAVARATPAIWTGPYATATSGMLGARKTTLHQMAAELTQDAGRWETEAHDLDDQATKAAAKQKAGGG
ncbi:MAG: hypothetical protein HOY69_10965 [Streptomyces sp.]|nr:hypothetical protein [Streptomyces sp.]